LKSIIIGKHIIPLWLITVLSISGIGAVVLANYALNALIIPFEVKEPIEITYYPSELSLFPGETEAFNITVQNHASVTYLMTLTFDLSNTTYQDTYVTFSNENYTVLPGQQNLTAGFRVESYAPPVEASLTIKFERLGDLTFTFIPTEELKITEVVFWGTQSHINITMRNTGTGSVLVTEIRVNGVTEWSEEITIQPGYEETVTLNFTWVSGIKYEFKVVSSSGSQFLYVATAP